MNIVLTGSIGNIGKPLTELLVKNGHSVTVISSKTERSAAIEALGAKAAIGAIYDVDFLTATVKGADIVYLMEAWENIGSIFNKDLDFISAFNSIGNNYKKAIEQAGIQRVVHLSSIGAHTNKLNGSLLVHHNVEQILQGLPPSVSIKFMRPVGFYNNLFRAIQTIKTQGAIVQAYGGNQKEPWVSPLDIAVAIAEAMEQPFNGRTVRYIASDEVSPNEIAAVLGGAIAKPDLKWQAVPGEQILNGMLSAGVNPWIATGFVEMQEAQGNGSLYEDYLRNKPTLGNVKLADFAGIFAQVYNQSK